MSYTNSDKPRPVRSRALTERGRLYEIGECQRRRSQLEAKIRTQLLVVETLIEDNRVDKLSEEIQLTENLFTEYSRVHSKCQILIQSGVEEDDAHSTESIDRRFNSIRRKVSELLDSSSKSERKTDRQSKSKSLKSSRKGSSIRSIASHIAKEKARIAELQVEAEFAQEQQRLEQDARNLTLRLEMAKAEAKLQAYQSSDIEDCSQNLDDLPAEVDKSQKVADYINRHLLSVNDVSRQNEGIVPPVDQSVDGGDHQDQDHQEEDQPSRKSTKVNARTLEVKLGRRQNVPQSIQREDNPFAVRPPIDQMYGLTHLINHLQAPTVEIDTFSGNCIDYPYFITTFIEVVETRISDPRGRLIRLLKYLDEEAKELVQACVYLPADEGYKKARQLLEKNYGDQYRILSEYRKELRSWPKLKPDDGRAFKKFYSFLVKYKSTMQCVSKSSRYDSPELVQRLQLCLPSFLQARWNRRSYTIRKATREEAGIDIFIDFMEEEMLLVNDPNFSRNALADLKEDTPRPTTMQTTQKRFKTMLTKNSITCPKCSNDHDLDDCEEYLKLNRFDRRNFVFRSRLCFSCYSPTGEGHNGMTCKNKRKCAICNEAHPTGLHGYQRKKKPPDEKQNKAVNVNCSKLQSEVISLNVVPVKITHPSSSVEIFKKALLDTGSQGTFIHEKILKDLHVQTTPTSISIKTVNGESTEKCQTISKLQISAVKDPDNKLCLPKVYSRPFIPVDKEEIPTPSKVAKWKYLDEIHPHLQHDDDAEEVGILIGANCPRALEPLETIPSQGSGPYAFRSVLGWCVTGPIINKVPSTSKQRCNFVSIANNNIRFVMQDEIKEQGLGEMMLKMFQQDFSENNKVGESENLSINDKKFLRIMDENVKLIDGHYQLPLPFKKQIMDVPNNKSLAIKRVFSLKKKLQTNKKMHEDYCTFMKNIFDKGFAEKCDSSSENGKTWYLPHHGVYHPKKPNKIRVVFDCSAKYGGVSLNSLLLQGPDLTNQIIGVLTRFREDQVALVGDIESMFYQVRVPKDQRDMKIDVDLLQKAEVAIIRFVQQEVFKVEWRGLLAGDKKRKLGSLSRLSPFLDSDSIVRVGGRIDKSSSLDWIIKHPIILPKNHPITVLVIRHFHEKVHHGGRDATLNEIRQRGFMIVNASSRVRNEIYKCVTCRRLRGKMGDQRMADLPEERCSEAAPFTYTGVDMFGPFVIKEGRKELKRYGAIFTCLSSRSIHLESTNSLETDSFILALRRFINRRGEVRQMRSDNGTNFVGASKELQKAVKEMDQMKITDFLLQHNTDWLGWEFNTPTASHMGGVWERQIRSCRSILSSLLNNHGQSLNDECFRTVLTEVEAIVNSRPLSVESLNDSDSLTPLTPNLLLTAKSKIVMAPPGDFNKSDIYSRRRWRRVQHLVDEFWCRWRTEYLQSLQARNKWQLKKRNFVVGDVVILKDEGVQRNEWRLARVTEAHQSEGGDVRSVVVQTSTGKNYTRPITKIVLLVEAE